MRIRIRPWALSLAMSALCVAVVLFFVWQRQRADSTDAQLMTRLPVKDSVQFYMDVQALRSAGLLDLLAGSRAAEETDYRRFVDSTGFDYRDDLDAIFLSYRSGRWYFMLRGRFDWEQLRRYAALEGGRCTNGYCNVPSRSSDKIVSFYALQPEVLALAIGDSPNGAYALSSRYDTSPAEEEIRHPIWIRVAATAIDESSSLPDGSRPFVTALKMTQRVTLTLDASPQGGFELRLRALCESDQRAGEVFTLLKQRTDMLQAFIARDKLKVDPSSMAAVIAGGTFQRNGSTVVGTWPLQRSFLEAVAGGSM